ncbi:MAG: tetratricopeptide repeat protein [Anaerolineales bacterium]|nr:tetratricopeptide repeat protein [Anaerolineales bacterium]
MSELKMFEEALNAIQRGERARAKDLLTRLLRSDQQNKEYWMYLSSVVDTSREQIYCLQNVLKIDPKSEVAKRGLILLGAETPGQKITPVRPRRTRPFEIGEMGLPQISEKEEKKKRRKSRRVGLSIAGLLILAAIVVYGVYNPDMNKRTIYPTSTVGTLQAQLTATALGTPVGGTPTPTVLMSPSPTIFNTYTPTPLFVDTPHPDSDSYRLALGAASKGNYKQALSFFEQALENDPESLDILYYIGEMKYQLGQYENARVDFAAILKEDSEFAPAYIGRAKAVFALKPDSTTIPSDLTDGIKYGPEYPEAYIERARYRFYKGNYDGMLEDGIKIIDLVPISPLGYLFAAQADLALGETEAALEYTMQALDIDNSIPDGHLILGQVYYESDLFEDAINEFRYYVEHIEHSEIGWFNLGKAYLANGEYEQAAETFDTVFELKEDYWDVYYYRGEAYLGLQEYEHAISDLKNATRISPKRYLYQVALGQALIESGAVAEGYFAINAIVNKVEEDELKARVYYWRAYSLEILGQPDAAMRDWQILVELPKEVVGEEWHTFAYNRTVNGIPTPTPTPSE